MLERVHDGRGKDVRGVDLGGTYLCTALADEEGEIRPTRQDCALAHEGCDAVLGRTIVLLEESRGQTDGGVAAVEAPPSTER